MTLLANSTSHLIKGLEENAMYRITLGALNMAGVGENSSVNIKTPIAGMVLVQFNSCNTYVHSGQVGEIQLKAHLVHAGPLYKIHSNVVYTNNTFLLYLTYEQLLAHTREIFCIATTV